MWAEILDYLYSFKDYKWHELNDFLKQTFPDDTLFQVRKALIELEQASRIEIKNGKHKYLASHQKLNDMDAQNTETTLDNWPILGKLTNAERERMNKAEKDANRRDTVAVYGDIQGHVMTNPQLHGDHAAITYNKPEKKKWWNKPLELLSKYFIHYAASGILSFIAGLQVGKSCNPIHSQLPSQKASSRTQNSVSSNKDKPLLDDVKQNTKLLR